MSLVRTAILLCCLAFAGCRPGSQGSVDEQKEPYFLAAKRRMMERDYQGAIDYFEKALDVNPRSAAAHIELGILYENQKGDWASALYHYTRALQIRPDYPSSDIIGQHVDTCKRELAKSVVQLPSVEALQRKVDTLAAENQQLRQTLQLWQSYYASRGIAPPALSNAAPAQAETAVRAPAANPQSQNSPANTVRREEPAPAPAPVTRAPETPRSRLHTVVQGETMERIAKKYGMRVTALQAANPTLDPRRMRAGQTLVIPSGSQ